jgi:hypothetical protein
MWLIEFKAVQKYCHFILLPFLIGCSLANHQQCTSQAALALPLPGMLLCGQW